MSKPETLKIDDVEYVRKDSVTQSATGCVKIAILDRGFVYVGNMVKDGDFFVITNAKNIRKWGTTKGLGELVNGPLRETVLDTVGTVRFLEKALIAIIDVNQSKWN